MSTRHCLRRIQYIYKTQAELLKYKPDYPVLLFARMAAEFVQTKKACERCENCDGNCKQALQKVERRMGKFEDGVTVSHFTKDY